MNSTLRTIELTTYMLTPALAGQLFTFVGYIWTGIFIAAWNVVSVTIEYALLNAIYKKYPRLSEKGAQEDDNTSGNNNVKGKDDDQTKMSTKKETIGNYLKETAYGWKIYFTHPVRNAGIGLALLYMTVLGFDNITYVYVTMQGVPEAVLGGVVAVSALVGVFGSMGFYGIRKCVGLKTTGFIGMFLLVTTSSLSVASVFVPSSPFWHNFDDPMFDVFKVKEYTSVIVLLVGITVARFGLWIVDLSVTQILQENVDEERRGIVNGVQDSMNNTLDLVKCILVIFLPQRELFGVLIILSFASISLGWLFYTIFYCKNNGKEEEKAAIRATATTVENQDSGKGSSEITMV